MARQPKNHPNMDGKCTLLEY
uniref:Uncharacterized protein n=1 Tax=Anguilla anguilla TaxID=7936 RepID=A0A0E9XCX4_ANGAN